MHIPDSVLPPSTEEPPIAPGLALFLAIVGMLLPLVGVYLGIIAARGAKSYLRTSRPVVSVKAYLAIIIGVVDVILWVLISITFPVWIPLLM